MGSVANCKHMSLLHQVVVIRAVLCVPSEPPRSTLRVPRSTRYGNAPSAVGTVGTRAEGAPFVAHLGDLPAGFDELQYCVVDRRINLLTMLSRIDPVRHGGTTGCLRARHAKRSGKPRAQPPSHLVRTEYRSASTVSRQDALAMGGAAPKPHPGCPVAAVSGRRRRGPCRPWAKGWVHTGYTRQRKAAPAHGNARKALPQVRGRFWQLLTGVENPGNQMS